MVDKYLQNKGEISCPKSSISIMSEHMCLLALWVLLFFFLILDVVDQSGWLRRQALKKYREKKKAGSLFKGPVKLKSELLPFLSHVTLAKSVDLGSITCKIVTQQKLLQRIFENEMRCLAHSQFLANVRLIPFTTHLHHFYTLKLAVL